MVWLPCHLVVHGASCLEMFLPFSLSLLPGPLPGPPRLPSDFQAPRLGVGQGYLGTSSLSLSLSFLQACPFYVQGVPASVPVEGYPALWGHPDMVRLPLSGTPCPPVAEEGSSLLPCPKGHTGILCILSHLVCPLVSHHVPHTLCVPCVPS